MLLLLCLFCCFFKDYYDISQEHCNTHQLEKVDESTLVTFFGVHYHVDHQTKKGWEWSFQDGRDRHEESCQE